MNVSKTIEIDSNDVSIAAKISPEHLKMVSLVAEKNERSIAAQLRFIIREWVESQAMTAKRR
jgi:hypothetical protein